MESVLVWRSRAKLAIRFGVILPIALAAYVLVRPDDRSWLRPGMYAGSALVIAGSVVQIALAKRRARATMKAD